MNSIQFPENDSSVQIKYIKQIYMKQTSTLSVYLSLCLPTLLCRLRYFLKFFTEFVPVQRSKKFDTACYVELNYLIYKNWWQNKRQDCSEDNAVPNKGVENKSKGFQLKLYQALSWAEEPNLNTRVPLIFWFSKH